MLWNHNNDESVNRMSCELLDIRSMHNQAHSSFNLRQRSQKVTNIIRNSLRIRRTSGTASKDMIRQLRDFISRPVRHVTARRDARIATQHHAARKGQGDNRRARADFAVLQGGGFGTARSDVLSGLHSDEVSVIRERGRGYESDNSGEYLDAAAMAAPSVMSRCERKLAEKSPHVLPTIVSQRAIAGLSGLANGYVEYESRCGRSNFLLCRAFMRL